MANPAAKIIERAVALKAAYPGAAARDILDELILAHKGVPLVFVDHSPSSPFGQIVAEAFDLGMEPDYWVGLTSESQPSRLRVMLLRTWRDEVWPKLAHVADGLIEPRCGVESRLR